MLTIDRVATNPAIHFRVVSFLPAEGFKPSKAYATRLLWRDLDGNDQSKLPLSEPEMVLAIAVRREAEPVSSPQTPARRPSRKPRSAGAMARMPES